MMKHGLFALLLTLIAGTAVADEIDNLLLKLKPAMPGLQKDQISPSPVEGIYEVSRGFSFFYVTSDGRYVFSGDLVDVGTGTSITENNRKSLRLQALDRLGENSMIVFPAKDEKYVVTVFTDIDCGYCRKLHREMADYNKEGITMRYLFYPRSGPNTPSYQKAEAVWCSDNRNIAMTTAKQGGNVEAESCATPVGEHYEAGQKLGVRGTPALVLPDGSVQPGYLPAERLKRALLTAKAG